MTRGGVLYYLSRYVVLGVITVAFVFPIYWMGVLSLDGPHSPFSLPPRLWPDWNFQNFVEAWHGAPWARS